MRYRPAKRIGRAKTIKNQPGILIPPATAVTAEVSVEPFLNITTKRKASNRRKGNEKSTNSIATQI